MCKFYYILLCVVEKYVTRLEDNTNKEQKPCCLPIPHMYSNTDNTHKGASKTQQNLLRTKTDCPG